MAISLGILTQHFQTNPLTVPNLRKALRLDVGLYFGGPNIRNFRNPRSSRADGNALMMAIPKNMEAGDSHTSWGWESTACCVTTRHLSGYFLIIHKPERSFNGWFPRVFVYHHMVDVVLGVSLQFIQSYPRKFHSSSWLEIVWILQVALPAQISGTCPGHPVVTCRAWEWGNLLRS